jgi:hypothetical protein
MPNHVHLVLTPRDSDGIRRALAKVHKAYAGAIHACLQRMGHFWQGRFGCVAMDEAHLLAAVRYLAYNPVRARLVERPEDRRWSSARVRLGRVADDGLTDPQRCPALLRGQHTIGCSIIGTAYEIEPYGTASLGLSKPAGATGSTQTYDVPLPQMSPFYLRA